MEVRGQRWLSFFSHCSPLCFDSLRQSLTDLKLAKEDGLAAQGSPRDCPVSTFPVLGLQKPNIPPCPAMCILGSDSGPQALYQLGLLLLSFEGVLGQLFPVEFQCGLKRQELQPGIEKVEEPGGFSLRL